MRAEVGRAGGVAWIANGPPTALDLSRLGRATFGGPQPAALEEAGHDDHAVRVIEGAGHAIWAPDTDHAAHDHRLHPDLVELLSSWIAARTTGR